MAESIKYWFLAGACLMSVILVLQIASYTDEVPQHVNQGLLQCDAQQQEAQKPILPECYMNVFRQNNVTSRLASDYIMLHLNISIMEKITQSPPWREAWQSFNG